ncbi:MAG: prolyl oligopeptidase family serine peptidase [Candidatus Tectimicrobiota bacterium]
MGQEKPIVQYGLWPSPLSPRHLAEGLRLSEVAWDSDGQTLVWLEGRSDRGVLVCLPPGGDAPRDLTTDLAVRARVGYGGGDFSVAGGVVYFAEASGRLYRQPLAAGRATPLTPPFGYAAAPTVSPDQQWVVFVHTEADQDCLAMVDAAGQFWPQKLVQGADFYMQPVWHPQGSLLAWIEWSHPQMPWEGSRLCVGTVYYEAAHLPRLGDIRQVAGSTSVSIQQPTFSPDGRWLVYISNQTGWENLYGYDLHTHTQQALTADAVDCGQPAWIQGVRTYGWRHDGQGLYYLRHERGFRRLWYYDLQRRTATDQHAALEPYTAIDQPAFSPTRALLACIASAPVLPPRLITVGLEAPASPRVCRRSSAEHLAPTDLATPQAITWSAASGETIHGLFYPPTHSQVQGHGLPPAILYIHGGPTSQAVASFHPQTQFFSTRGYAVLQVNHRGSSGYGSAYLAALRGQWGVYDVEDVRSGAQYLIDQGLASAQHLVLMGGSAGGYTVLQTLVTHPGFFKAAICLYGISNLFTLAATTHKFEAHYLDSLVGRLPEAAALYRARSPLYAAARLCDPIALFQGDMDQVVPRAQAEVLVASLASRGVPHEYHVYAGEGHGWRKTETIAHFYTAVEAFLRQYVVFA